MTAKTRYDVLSSDRSQFLRIAEEATDLTLPYLIRGEGEYTKGAHELKTPWQSVGAKGVVTLASKLMLALLPPQTSFFKLQLDDSTLEQGGLPPEAKSELDLSFAKIERTILESIAASSDRVIVHQALKHLVVAGNVLIFMGQQGLKMFPLNRYVLERDGNGNVIEIVTKERVHHKLLEKEVPPEILEYKGDDDSSDIGENECDVYTHVIRDNNRFVWHQEVYDFIIPASRGKAPVDVTPWLPLRFNTVDGEAYGRGRVEEFIGAIIQGRPDDIGVVQVGKTADFATAFQLTTQIGQRISEAFLILNVRNSERTTAEEVRMTQMELDQQLGGLYSLLTVEFLVPYLNRKLTVFQKTGEIPRIPADLVKPTIVAGVNALGRGQDRESLVQFLGTIAQAMGPDGMMAYINPEEAIKRLAAAQGIDTLNLVKSMQEVEAKEQQMREQQMQLEQSKLQVQAMNTPMADPTKNPQLADQMSPPQ